MEKPPRRVHPLKRPLGMDFTLSGRTMPVKLEQWEKAYPPREVTLSGMAIVGRLVQPEKAYWPMLVKFSGRTMLVRLVQSENR